MEKQQIIQQSLATAIDYQQYRNLLAHHSSLGTSTSIDHDDQLAQYTKLNNQRMKRLDKTLTLAPQHIAFLTTFDRPIAFLIITESWCGDAAQTMPMINKIAQAASIPMHIVLRDQHPLLMDQFLTNGSRSIAKMIIIDQDNKPIHTWGPRSTNATQLVNDYKLKHGALTADFKQELQHWYNQDRGVDVANDIINLLQDIG